MARGTAKVLRVASIRRINGIVLVVLVLIPSLLSGCGSPKAVKSNLGSTVARANSIEYVSFQRAGCPGSSSALSSQRLVQSMNGAVAGCLRIGALAPGKYHVSIEAVEIPRGSAAVGSGLSAPSRVQAGPAVSLVLTPEAGIPGSVVHIAGSVAYPLKRRPGHVEVCWGGCEAGLHYSGVPITWTSSKSFIGSIVTPAAPWFESGTGGVAPLRTGNYKISVECLTLVRGCGLGSGEGSASYRLRVPSGAAPWCPTSAQCAVLRASNSVALPGDIVKIQGFAPLMSVIGSKDPFQFELKVSRGPAPPGELTFGSNPKGGSTVSMGHAAITVGLAPTFASLGSLAPANSTDAGLAPVSENPANPGDVAWCGQGGIGLEGPDGSGVVSTASAAGELRSLGYGSIGGSSPSCDSVALADGGKVGKIILASFPAAANLQAPPFVNIALETLNEGKSWMPLPVPKGTKLGDFGGFRYASSSVQALFSQSAPGALGSHAPPLVETLKGGSSSWGAGTFQCPSRGPCVTFGSYVAGNCAMNGTMQRILYSTDGGKDWLLPPWPSQVQACRPSELVPISSNKELLISPGSPYLIRESVDGGASWKVIGLPSVPGSERGSGIDSAAGAKIQMLADGSLLVSGQRGKTDSWELLNPGSNSWCQVEDLPSGVLNSSKSSQLYQLGSTLFWISRAGASNGSGRLHSLAESGVSC